MIIHRMNDLNPLPDTATAAADAVTTLASGAVAAPTATLHGVALLSHWGVIRAEGEDAVKFLHNQLTQDFALLDQSHARLCALCSAKGRMQASFIGFKRSPTEVLLLCRRDILAPTLKRLSMFVLRAKLKLSDASAEFQITGLIGNALDSIAPDAHSTWAKVDIDAENLIFLYPALGQARALRLSPAGMPLPTAPLLDAALWDWTDVHSGVALISAPLVEAFVPQMLNYESVGGVSFKKGCYPGQEVVARSQFRGTLKRRAYIVHAEAPLEAGQPVFGAEDAEQATGLIVQAAPSPLGGWDAIASFQTSSASHTLHAGSAQGTVLKILPLPYPLLDDI